MADRLLTPQQELFLSYYTNPKSETFSNALQSALKAGYSETFANNITSLMPEWLYESMGDMKRLKKAEKNLDEVQNLAVVDEEGKVDVNLLDKRMKVDMFYAKALNRKKYSDKTDIDVTSGGEKIASIINIIKPDGN